MNDDDLGELPPPDSTPPPVDKVSGIDVLLMRPFRNEDFEAENRALVALADELANQPRNLLQRLADIALELCHAGSAGVSILEPDGEAHRWHAGAGSLARSFTMNASPALSHFDSPCGMVINRNAPILFEEPARHFAVLRSLEPPITEVLLLPFHDESKPVGTVWVIAHSPERKFDREDLRLMTSLSRFASAAYHVTRSMDKNSDARDFL